MIKSTTTWVLIADGARANVYRQAGKDRHLEAVEGLELEADHAPTRDLLSDRPGRVIESHGRSRHAIEPKHDAHRELKRSFAERIAAVLEEMLAKRAFDHLVVVAPPRTLGDLRAAFAPVVMQVVTGQVAKDLTHLPPGEIATRLHGYGAL